MRCKLWIVVLVALVAVFTLVAAGAALAAGSQPALACATSASPAPPPGSVLVEDIAFTVVNQNDAGNVGYWALDDGFAHVRVWQVSPDNFYLRLPGSVSGSRSRERSVRTSAWKNRPAAQDHTASATRSRSPDRSRQA